MIAIEEKTGFKQTEVGMIPEDWEVKNLTDIGEIISGLTYKPADVSDHGTLVLRSSNIKENTISYDDNVYVDMKLPRTVVVREGDILICVRNGSKRLIGKCAFIDERAEGAAFGAFMSVFRSKVSRLVLFLFQSKLMQEQIRESLGATINQITNKDFKRFLIPLPPTLEEQQAIAEALGDVDELIRSLDALIEKKQAIKKGAMQELLTGKTRLPGFSEEWREVKLGELCDVINGGTPSTKNDEFWDGEIPWCTPTDITSNNSKILTKTERNITELGLEKSSATLLPKGALLLCSRATIGEIKIAGTEVATNQGFKSLVCYKDMNNEYLYYLIVFEKQKFITKAFGSTFLEISKKNTESIRFSIPKTEEQEAISEVLSDMDSEIQSLLKKRDKYKKIKRGMMQELLTGKTRLVENE